MNKRGSKIVPVAQPGGLIMTTSIHPDPCKKQYGDLINQLSIINKARDCCLLCPSADPISLCRPLLAFRNSADCACGMPTKGVFAVTRPLPHRGSKRHRPTADRRGNKTGAHAVYCRF